MTDPRATTDITRLTIAPDATLLAAMQQMDREGFKSLLLLTGTQLAGLISIGDIQRAIIRNVSLDTPVREVARSRKDIIVAAENESEAVIRQRMIEHRTAFMPVVAADFTLVRTLFWEDVFGAKHEVLHPLPADLPVVVMAGGFGSRLKPLTNVLPKPLIPVGEKTILETIIERFNRLGPSHFYLTVNYKSDLIRFYFENLPDRPYHVDYLLEDKPLGTAGSLGLLKGKIKTSFFVTNCDIVIEDDYAQMYDYHRTNRNDLTLVASLKYLRIPYGTVESGAAGELLGLREKPELTFMINTGMYILEPHVLDAIPDDTFIHITEVIETIKSNGGRVGVFPISEKSWYDIGEWPEYQKIIDKYGS